MVTADRKVSGLTYSTPREEEDVQMKAQTKGGTVSKLVLTTEYLKVCTIVGVK
jgi:hypothetical protein